MKKIILVFLASALMSPAHAEENPQQPTAKPCSQQVIRRHNMKFYVWMGGWVGTLAIGIINPAVVLSTVGPIMVGYSAFALKDHSFEHPSDAEKFYLALSSGDPKLLSKYEGNFRLADQAVEYLNTRLETDDAPITHQDLYGAMIKLDQAGRLCKNRKFFISKKEFKKRLLGTFVELGYEPREKYKKSVEKQLKSLEKMKAEDNEAQNDVSLSKS